MTTADEPVPQGPLPAGLHPDTLAVRAAVPRSPYGENSEALYLTSGYVQPDAETSARRFAGDEEGYTYTRSGTPTARPSGTAWRWTSPSGAAPRRS